MPKPPRLGPRITSRSPLAPAAALPPSRRTPRPWDARLAVRAAPACGHLAVLRARWHVTSGWGPSLFRPSRSRPPSRHTRPARLPSTSHPDTPAAPDTDQPSSASAAASRRLESVTARPPESTAPSTLSLACESLNESTTGIGACTCSSDASLAALFAAGALISSTIAVLMCCRPASASPHRTALGGATLPHTATARRTSHASASPQSHFAAEIRACIRSRAAAAAAAAARSACSAPNDDSLTFCSLAVSCTSPALHRLAAPAAPPHSAPALRHDASSHVASARTTRSRTLASSAAAIAPPYAAPASTEGPRMRRMAPADAPARRRAVRASRADRCGSSRT